MSARKGATAPGGDTEFEFNAGRLSFESTAEDWLVAGCARAQFKEVGTINGEGNYAFIARTCLESSAGGR